MPEGADALRRPRPWREASYGVKWYAKPAYWVAWSSAAFAFELHRSPFLALVKLAAAFALPVASITYCAEAKDRHRDRVYRTWDIVAKAEGRAASGARYEALQDLAENGVSLSRSELPGAWLEEIDLRGVDMRFSNIDNASMRAAKLGCRTILVPPRRRCTRLRMSSAAGADLAHADLRNADMELVNVDRVDLTGADLRDANLEALRGWQSVTGWIGTDLRGVRNAPPGLLGLAARSGALVDR